MPRIWSTAVFAPTRAAVASKHVKERFRALEGVRSRAVLRGRSQQEKSLPIAFLLRYGGCANQTPEQLAQCPDMVSHLACAHHGYGWDSSAYAAWAGHPYDGSLGYRGTLLTLCAGTIGSWPRLPFA